ncbi:hypothetical protein NHX12_016403, partial [Muraenolepis orangiensis]
MTACMENRKETVRSKLLTSRRPTTIATWNVRTMYAGGKAAVIAEEMKRYGISLLGLGETRWLQSGQVKLASGETILYSGHPEDSAPHTEGVAFMLSKEAQRALISWEPINSRIITAKFQTTHKKINLQVIQCYAPTNDTDDETKDQFYNQLYTILQDRKGKDIIILMGDMNAKIGGNNNGFEPVMGREGLGTMNANGERFAAACADNNLVIGGSVFQHKNIHKATWVSPDHTTENQIDHICISQKFRHSLLDVRARRGADAGSDHHLLTAKIQLKLKRMKHREVQCQHNIKSHLMQKFRRVFEGIAKAGQSTDLNDFYTELFITERISGEVNKEHEVRLIETASRKPAKEETPIKCEDIFKPLPGQDQPSRTIMTTGVAGIGKTILTHKFTLDWAEGKANHDIHFTLPFTFRELNLLKEKEFSLMELLHHFFIQTKGIRRYDRFQVVFILDGLDECRLPLDFQNNPIWTDVTKSTSVDILLTNLIRGDLLPSARIWITTRPAAANQIPAECVDMVTEVRGFTDPQKEEYFRKRFREEPLASKIISHIKTSRSIHI